MFADIGIGIMSALSAAAWFSVPLTSKLILFGVLFILLPDIDMLGFVFPRLGRILEGHRGITHYPLVYIPIAVLFFVFAGSIYTFLFVLCISLHLIHDTLWIGHGVKWLWPFSNKPFKFFSQNHVAKPGEHWIKTFYFQLNVVTIVEYSVFILSLITLGIYTR